MMQTTYNLSVDARRNIAEDLQVASFSDVLDMDALTLDNHIERIIGKKLNLSPTLGRLIGRGSLYTWFNRLLTRRWIDRQISKIK
ncbi:MAG: hypothetical protein IJK22_08405 [Bacteroidales bacterium]|nr:hypothetical protein [Bacteroidales bacterium]